MITVVVCYTLGMSKRLQVVVEDAELRRFESVARERGLTVSEWVRQVLRTAERESSLGSSAEKLAALRMALRHSFPAPDMAQMNEEIERGYRGAAGA